MATTNPKTKFTITLSDRPPVAIDPARWPVIAQADTFYGGNGIECQANEVAKILVRQHADGRTLVYCVRDRGPGGMPLGYRGRAGGYLLDTEPEDNLDADADPRPAAPSIGLIVRTIRRCAGVIDAPELGDECIADMQPEEI